ncbi:uncharacterized protein LOC143233497 [Tachypleus tridentatus]|uniref:uncharacterized protein LOC143233497 n=1 Tax=Tachypleus tridentatus TaxID=6853 RepID=UPI003FD58808
MRIKGLQLITRRLPLKQEFISRVLFTPKIPLQLYQKHFSETTCRLQAEKSNDDALYFQHLFYEIHPKLKGPSVNINLQELNRNHENKLDQSVEEWTEKNTIRHKTRYETTKQPITSFETTKQPITSFETVKLGIIKQHDVLKTDQNQMESNKENIHQLKKIYASSENYKEQKQRYTLQSSPVSQVKESDLETNNQLDLSPHDHLSSSLEPEFIDCLSPVSLLSSYLEPEFIDHLSPVKESDLETNNQLDLTQKICYLPILARIY